MRIKRKKPRLTIKAKKPALVIKKKSKLFIRKKPVVFRHTPNSEEAFWKRVMGGQTPVGPPVRGRHTFMGVRDEMIFEGNPKREATFTTLIVALVGRRQNAFVLEEYVSDWFHENGSVRAGINLAQQDFQIAIDRLLEMAKCEFPNFVVPFGAELNTKGG